MNTRELSRSTVSKLLIACAVLSMLLSACRPAVVPAAQQPSEPPAATALPEQPTEAAQPEQSAETEPPAALAGEITFDLSGVAEGQAVETVEGVPANDENPYWVAMPRHYRVTLQGYPVSGHSLQPQIFVYPVAGLAEFNEVAAERAASLKALLQSRQAGEQMPYLPIYNARQIMHPQAQYLDFKNGSGVRYLTQFNTGIVPVNNQQMVYTYQGLTGDGSYYVAAVLPVTHPELPATDDAFAKDEAGLKEYPAFMEKTIAWLGEEPGGSFTPDLAKLDALVQSMEVK